MVSSQALWHLYDYATGSETAKKTKGKWIARMYQEEKYDHNETRTLVSD